MTDPFIVKKPWITEKATALQKEAKYVFIVKQGATKPEIKKAVKEIYKVEPVAVNIVNRPAKSKKMGALRGHQSGYKKAVVTLEAGQKIDLGR